MHFTVVQVVATLAAFLAQFSRIFAVTKPFWGKLPAFVQVWLPPIVPFVAALQAQIAGATTWTDFAVAVIVSAALLVPGAPSNRSAAPLQAAKPFKPPPLAMIALLCFAAGATVACSSAPPKPPCDATTLAVITAECSAKAFECGRQGIPKAECTAIDDCSKRLDSRKEICR